MAVVVGGALAGAGLAVSWLLRRRAWRGEGLIMHELICPMGELQDPEFGDRRRWAARMRR
jgi:hypothetical protein